MIRSKRGLVTTGLIIVLLGLVITLPARVAVAWFVPSPAAVNGIAGSAWHGSAREVGVNGIYLRDLRWRLNALSLFTGKLSYHVEATPVSGLFESDISIGIGGVLSLTDLTAALPLSLFADASGLRGLQGNARLNFERLQIEDGLATAADGTVQVASLIVPIVGRDALGDFRAEFFTQNNGIAASIEDTDAVLDLAGSFQLRSDRSYEFLGQVIANPDTPQNIRQQLRFLPPANDRGQQELRLEGVL